MLKYHIQTIEVGAGGAAGITFTNIPQDYDDLEVVTSVRTTRSLQLDDLKFVFNNDTTNSSGRILYGDGTATGSILFSYIHGGATNANTATANTFGNTKMLISNYSSSLPKPCSADGVSESNETKAGRHIAASLYNSTLPVTSIFITGGSGTLLQYSSASLYGIKRGSSGESLAATGGTITVSGGYTYHTFRSSGDFILTKAVPSIEALVIAGGGGGGLSYSGGGGAGGVLYSSLDGTPGTHGVVVGAGGGPSINGSNSVFKSLTAIGGGRGGNGGNNLPATGGGDGGSGGGGGGGYSPTNPGGTGTVGQGNNGGVGGPGTSSNERGAGGGGAGAAGQNWQSGSGGAGGIGTNAYSTWASATSTGVSGYYGGGGGGGSWYASGGAGGLGGGGTGQSSSGTANTGGGGGGSYNYDTPHYSGGSGIVIIRYLTPA